MKGKKSLVLLVLVVFTIHISGCVIQLADPGSQPQPGPKLQVVFPEKNLRDYIRLARQGATDLDSLYWENVLGPIQMQLDQANSSIQIEDYHQTIYNLDELEFALDQLKDVDVTRIVKTALHRSNDYIQGVDYTVYIIPCNPADDFTRDKMRGVRGISGLTCGNSIIAINPLGQGWQETLPYVAAHEYYHVIWSARNVRRWEGDVLGVLVMEGKADAFANIVYPGLAVPWTHSLPTNREDQIWRSLQEHLDSTDLNFAKELTQDEYWSGYAIGYHIVQVFMYNHPDVSIDQWTDMSSKDILDDSGYEEWLAN